MSITHAEFFRILPSVAGTRGVRVKGDKVWIVEEGREIWIRLSEEKERVIGALRLPMTDIELQFFGHTDLEAKDFMDRFDLHYRRGGG